MFERRYELREPLASGGMGTVYRARDRQLRREVAVKVVRTLGCLSSGLRTRELQRRIRAEGRVLACLEHPSIVPLYDVSLTADGAPCLVMKLVARYDAARAP